MGLISFVSLKLILLTLMNNCKQFKACNTSHMLTFAFFFLFLYFLEYVWLLNNFNGMLNTQEVEFRYNILYTYRRNFDNIYEIIPSFLLFFLLMNLNNIFWISLHIFPWILCMRGVTYWFLCLAFIIYMIDASLIHFSEIYMWF